MGRPEDVLEELRIVVEAMPASVTRCSRDLRYVWVTKQYAAWLGRDAADLRGQRIVDVIGVDAFRTLSPYIERVLSGERVEFEEYIPFQGSGRHWIHGVYTPTFGTGTTPNGWIAVVADVDARRRADELLRQSEAGLQRLAAIVESSDDAIISKDLNGHVTSWNRAAERMFGYTAEEMVGRSIRTIIPSDRQGEEDVVLSRIRGGEAVEHFETMRRRSDDTLIPISLTVSPVRDVNGHIIGASKIARDISHRKRIEALAERASRQAVFLAQVSSALTQTGDPEHMFAVLASAAVPEIADWCAIDLVGDDGQITRRAMAPSGSDRTDLPELLWPRTAGPSPNSPEGVIRTRTPVLVPDVNNHLSIGARGHDEERLRLLRSLGVRSYICVPLVAHDRPAGAMTLVSTSSNRPYTDDDLRFATDLALRVSLAAENARAFRQLEAANRLKDEFVATLSHELRTPLNAVLGYARMLKTGSLVGERATQALQVVERNAKLLTQIVEDVLDVSRIISGKARLQVQAVLLQGVVDDAIETVALAAEAKGVRIETFRDSGTGPISGDPDRLQQVIWNLLSNAVKFTPRGGHVHVRLQRLNAHVEIVVSDTGIGIPPDFLPHIFERFRQADAGTKRLHGGLGLGLAIARHIIEMHGGTIQAASDGEGKGATFRVELPLMMAPAAAAVDVQHGYSPMLSGAVVPFCDLTGIHVLAVDDDPDALGLLREILEVAGARVTTATSGAEALDALYAVQPDVLIADLGMPMIDGFDLIRSIREIPNPALSEIPAAALTAYARSEDRAKALRSGFGMHLAKPIDPAELASAVAALARRRTPQI